jgi:hypothetical protein
MIMATDLPSRPPRDPDEAQSIIDPTERVKSAHDKPDPRFEAARQKAEREAEVYAERNEHAGASEEADEQPTPEPVDADATKGSFSFNMTGEAEEDE